MIKVDDLAEKVFSLLKGNRFQIKLYDADGNETIDPRLGRRFFVLDPNLMISIDEDSESIQLSKGKSVTVDLTNLQQGLRRMANEYLMNMDIKVFGKSIEPRHYSYQTKTTKDNMMEHKEGSVNSLILGKVFKVLDYENGMTVANISGAIPGSDLNDIQKALNRLEQDGKVAIIQQTADGKAVYGKKMVEANRQIYESLSKMYGTKKTSRQTCENVKIMVKHKKAVDESVKGSRSRNISAIFFEQNGERLRFPCNSLKGARAMARHLSFGGTQHDRIGSYIIGTSNQLTELAQFMKYTRSSNLINESTNNIITLVRESIFGMKSDLSRLASKTMYEAVKMRVESSDHDMEDESDDIEDLKEQFSINGNLDESLMETLAVVKKIVKENSNRMRRIEEASKQIIRIQEKKSILEDVVSFDTPHLKLGNKISDLSSRMCGNTELAEYVSSIGKKVKEEQPLTDFEINIMENVLGNSVIYEMDYADEDDELADELEGGNITEVIMLESYFKNMIKDL